MLFRSANTGNVTFSNTSYYSGQQITSADPLILRGNNYVTSVINDKNDGFAELWWHNRDLELGNASNNTPLDADLYVENDGMWLYNGALDNSNNYVGHSWHWGMDGISKNPALTIEMLREFRDKEWVWDIWGISSNPALTIEMLREFRDKDWIWGEDGISRNPALTIEILQEFHDKDWDWRDIFKNHFEKDRKLMCGF